MFQIVPEGVLTLTAVLLSWGLALVLYRVSLPDSVARKLALLLVFEGLTLGSSDAAYYLLASPEEFLDLYPWLSQVQSIIHTFGDCGMLALYPPFLAAALQTRLTRPFGRKKVRYGLMVYSIVVFFVALLAPFEIGIPLLYLSLTAVFFFALVASIQAWYQATGMTRSRALIFVLAFGFRDICWGFIYVAGTWEIWTGITITHHVEVPLQFLIYILGTLVAVPLIAYGILRTQMFDIDLRIRWTIKTSTVGAVVVGLMFVLSETAEALLSEEFGTAGGITGAVLGLLLLPPIKRFAERVAGKAMPNTHNTPAYVSGRKKHVYEEAIAEAKLEDGISDRERSLLNRLRDSLGISEADALAIESGVAARS